MTDEAARAHPGGEEPTEHLDPPQAWTPPAPDAGPADEPPPPPPPGEQPPPPPPGGPPPPPPPPPPGAGAGTPPPWFGSGGGARGRLVRPTHGRYIAGVCGALGRATNTDPVLWRVLLAVLGFFGGVGVLIYLIGWLAIPSEGDTASPIESLLGRGRSGMTPVSVVLLGLAAVVTFGFIVHDGFRATVLAAAVITGAVLLLRRSGWTANNRNGGPGESRTTTNPPTGTWYPPFGGGPTAPGTASSAAGPPAPADSPAPGTEAPVTSPAGAGEPPTAPLPTTSPGYAAPAGPGYTPPGFTPPPGGYRPPFAPHGPWASGQSEYRTTPVQAPPKQPKPPRERSKLGRITFFTLLFVLGMMALAHAAGAAVPVSAYFAAALTIAALGLIVGAWFGRARGLIFLAVVATLGLLISSGAERWGANVGDNIYRPRTFAAVADRYDVTVGKTTLDLRAVDFTGQQKNVTITTKVGQVEVLLPDKVDTTAVVDLHGAGRAMLFGREWNGSDLGTQQVTDLGADGTGGGTLNLTVDMNAGNVEVIR